MDSYHSGLPLVVYWINYNYVTWTNGKLASPCNRQLLWLLINKNIVDSLPNRHRNGALNLEKICKLFLIPFTMNRKFNTIKIPIEYLWHTFKLLFPRIYLGTFEITSNMEEYSYYTQSIKNQFSHLGPKYVMASILSPCERRLF